MIYVATIWGVHSFRIAAHADAHDRREIVGSIIVVSDSDTPELLDPIEEALNEIVQMVESGVGHVEWKVRGSSPLHSTVRAEWLSFAVYISRL